MGRTVSDEPKAETVKIKIQPSQKKIIEEFQSKTKYHNFQVQEFLMMLVEIGLEVEKIEEGWHSEAINTIAKQRQDHAGHQATGTSRGE